jgi:hypothetical protein
MKIKHSLSHASGSREYYLRNFAERFSKRLGRQNFTTWIAVMGSVRYKVNKI